MSLENVELGQLLDPTQGVSPDHQFFVVHRRVAVGSSVAQHRVKGASQFVGGSDGGLNEAVVCILWMSKPATRALTTCSSSFIPRILH